MGFLFDWIEIHAVDHCNNSCDGCNNHSPYAPKRQYEAQDYIPWLELMLEQKMSFKCISVMGGEPFLHKDLHGFISALKNKFSQGIALSTNCFWLSERNIEYYRSLFNMLSLLNITIYPPFIEKFGGIDSIQNHLDRIRFNHPDMSLVVRHATSFYVLEYTDTPLVVDKYCGAADCTCLLPDGRLARCGPGAFAHLTPHATKQFLLGRDDLFYDLKKNPGDFWMWRRRWPLNACQFCTHFTHKTKPWQPVSTATKRNII